MSLILRYNIALYSSFFNSPLDPIFRVLIIIMTDLTHIYLDYMYLVAAVVEKFTECLTKSIAQNTQSRRLSSKQSTLPNFSTKDALCMVY